MDKLTSEFLNELMALIDKHGIDLKSDPDIPLRLMKGGKCLDVIYTTYEPLVSNMIKESKYYKGE